MNMEINAKMKRGVQKKKKERENKREKGTALLITCTGGAIGPFTPPGYKANILIQIFFLPFLFTLLSYRKKKLLRA